MPSKRVTDHGKAAVAVTSAIDAHLAAVDAALKARLAPHLQPGETPPDHALTLKLISRWIAQTNADYVAADEANLDTHSSTVLPRHNRDALVHSIGEAFHFQRDNVGSLYGHDAQVALGFKDPASPDPLVLSRQVHTAIARLRDPAIVLAAPRRRGATIDRQAFSDDLAAELPALEQSLDTVAHQASQGTATHAAKYAAQQAADRALTEGGALARAKFALAGKDDLFPRVHRPHGHG